MPPRYNCGGVFTILKRGGALMAKKTKYVEKYASFYESLNNLRDFIDFIADTYRDKTAIIFKDKTRKHKTEISYTKLREDVNVLSAYLLSKGIAGKRIAVIGPNSYEWLITYYAVMNNVGVLVPLDKGLPDDEIANSLALAETDVIVYDASYADRIAGLAETYGTKIETAISMAEFTQDKLANLAPLLDEYKGSFKEIDPDEVSLILFTSGTTSQAKAAMLTHRNIASNVAMLHKVEGLTEDDRGFIFLPLHHAFGSTGVSFLLSYGCTNAFCSGIKHFQKELGEYEISAFFCVPLIIEAMIDKVLKTADKQGKREKLEKARKISRALRKIGIDLRPVFFKEIQQGLGGHLRYLISGAAPMSLETIEYINDFGIEAIQGYGLTETAPVVAGESVYIKKPGTVGWPMPWVEVKLHEPNEEGIGELLVKGSNVMKGYLNPDDNAKAFIDGYYNTGDLASIDSDGCITIHGRLKNVVVLKNGKNIYPEEIEALIDKLPYAKENVVLGQEDGEDYRLVTKIVYDPEAFPGKTEDEIRKVIEADVEKINDDMPKYKRIKEVFLTTQEFEKTTTNKIKRNKVVL